MNHSQIVSFIWGGWRTSSATPSSGKYQDVILPFTVLRRLDCVLAPTKRKVLAVQVTARGGHTRSSSGTSRAVARLLSAFTDPGFTPRSMAER